MARNWAARPAAPAADMTNRRVGGEAARRVAVAPAAARVERRRAPRRRKPPASPLMGEEGQVKGKGGRGGFALRGRVVEPLLVNSQAACACMGCWKQTDGRYMSVSRVAEPSVCPIAEHAQPLATVATCCTFLSDYLDNL